MSLVNHDCVCGSGYGECIFVLQKVACFTFSMLRIGPLKIFIGSLSTAINKPKLIGLFERLGLEPAEIIVPNVKPGKMAVAFVCWNTSQEALNAVQACNGLVDSEVTPSPAGLHAHIGLDNGSLFLYQPILQIFWALGSY